MNAPLTSPLRPLPPIDAIPHRNLQVADFGLG